MSASVGFGFAASSATRGHDLAGLAEAALRDVLVDPRLLHRVQLVAVGEPLDRGDLAAAADARSTGRSMPGMHSASPPTWLVHAPHTPTPQPYFGPGHAEQVAQHPEQRHVGGHVDGARLRRSRSACRRASVDLLELEDREADDAARSPGRARVGVHARRRPGRQAELAGAAGRRGPARGRESRRPRSSAACGSCAPTGSRCSCPRVIAPFVEVVARAEHHRPAVDQHALDLRLEALRVDRNARRRPRRTRASRRGSAGSVASISTR